METSKPQSEVLSQSDISYDKISKINKKSQSENQSKNLSKSNKDLTTRQIEKREKLIKIPNKLMTKTSSMTSQSSTNSTYASTVTTSTDSPTTNNLIQTESWDDIIKYLMSRPPTNENNISVSKIHIAQKVYIFVIQQILDAVSSNDEAKQLLYLKKLFLLPTWFFTVGEKESVVINRAQQMLKNIWPKLETITKIYSNKEIRNNKKSNKFIFKTTESLQSEKIKKAMHHISEGLISKGFKTIEEKPSLDITPEVIEKLQKLHPKRTENIERITDHRSIGDLRFEEKVVREIINSLPKGKASGFSQLRSIHLRLLIGSQSDLDGEKFLKIFTMLLSHMANGILHKEFYTTLACSILIPIAKDSSTNPGVRPIALGDTLNKVVAKLLLRISKDTTS